MTQLVIPIYIKRDTAILLQPTVRVYIYIFPCFTRVLRVKISTIYYSPPPSPGQRVVNKGEQWNSGCIFMNPLFRYTRTVLSIGGQ